MKKLFYTFALLLVANIILSACSSSDPLPPIAVTGITLNDNTLVLIVGETETLIATVTPSDANNHTVTWHSSNWQVATVTNGIVTAVWAGTATITAQTACGKTAICIVTVFQRPTGVSLNRSIIEMSIGGSETLVATVTPSWASQIVSWNSSSPDVATIDENGIITAKTAGTTTITATTVGGLYTATCVVTVFATPPPTTDEGVVVNGIRWATRNVNAPGTFTRNPEDAGMFFQWGRNVGWSSTDPMFNSQGGTTWSTQGFFHSFWSSHIDPCPIGWRIPNTAELMALGEGRWTDNYGVRGVAGRVFGTAEEYVFFPATRSRSSWNGFLVYDERVRYWGNRRYGHLWGDPASLMDFVYWGGWVTHSSNIDMAIPVRCVAE